ncbi:hypothetical protein LSH36_838g00002, partial [Paralvinella palmiformis]
MLRMNIIIPIIATFCVIIYKVQVVFPCSKEHFNSILGKRGTGRVLFEVNGIEFNQCLKACRLTIKCYRFNFDGNDLEPGRCEILMEFRGLIDDEGWSYYVTCPEGMDYFELTGSCYGLSDKKANFE